jgi:Zn-dependent peptidase ImmA (M78 family)
MSLTWERLAGSTNRFAMRISFLTDPHEGMGVDPDTSLSWGALQFWAEGKNLCAHVDQGETLSSVHWYLLPFLEWLAGAWDPLLHEERLPVRNSGNDAASALFETRFAPRLADEKDSFQWEEAWYEWHQRHSLRAARDGGLFPNVLLRRFRDRVELSWEDEPLPGDPEGFSFSASRGVARLRPREVADPLHEVALAAAHRLVESRPESLRFQQLTRRLEELQSVARKDQRIAWLAGLTRRRSRSEETRRLSGTGLEETPILSGEPQSLWQRVTETLRSLGDERAADAALATEASPLVVTGSCQAALLFGAVAPQVSEADVATLAKVLIDQYDEAGEGLERLVDIEVGPPLLDVPAWQQGYELAEQLHDSLGDTEAWVDMEGLLDRLNVQVHRRSLSDQRIRGVSLVSPHHVPTIVLNPRFEFGDSTRTIRFTLAHELCHLLFDREIGQRLAIASGPWAPRDIERRANAFAAMFLMPPHLVLRVVADTSDAINTLAGVREVADRLQVGIDAVIHHLYNLGIMGESDRDALLKREGLGEF